ncbi:MAG: hypothetical protein IKS19_06130 [Clostridia bacterium]|nr:hypothetical protein [Clostridia bacterium]
MKALKKIVTTLFGTFLIYGAVALALKANIGVLPVDAAITSISDVSGVRVGYVAMMFHGLFFIGQILIERKSYRPIELLQLITIVFGGTALNFVSDVLLADLVITAYPLRLITAVSAFLLGAFGCRLVLETHFIRTAMEGCIQLIADRSGKKNGTLRQMTDAFLVMVSVSLTLIFTVNWSAGGFADVISSGKWRLREGTIIAALIFGPAMDIFRKPVQRALLALRIVEEKELSKA